MIPGLAPGRISFRNEIALVLVTVIVIISLPVLTLVSVTNVEALASPGVTLYSGPTSTADTYDFGNCTYWAALLRQQAGHPIPNSWGNANTWAIRAQAAGYTVDNSPVAGAIMQTTAGQYGHVAYVESVSPTDGSWTISEMNYKGWDEVDTRTLPALGAADYNFIH
jgi:surface antigen